MIDVEVSWLKVFVFFDTAGSRIGISLRKYAKIDLRSISDLSPICRFTVALDRYLSNLDSIHFC
jgi:hypothetical protein